MTNLAKIENGRQQPFWIYPNNQGKKWNIPPTSDLILHICWMTCVQNFITLSGFRGYTKPTGYSTRSRGREADWFEPLPGGYIISLKQKMQVNWQADSYSLVLKDTFYAALAIIRFLPGDSERSTMPEGPCQPFPGLAIPNNNNLTIKMCQKNFGWAG